MNAIQISTKKTATLNLVIDEREVAIPFSVASVDGYRKVSTIMSKYGNLAKEAGITDTENMSQEDALKAFDLSIDLMDELRAGVRTAIGDTEYSKHLYAIENDIPFPAWLGMLTAIIKSYGDYFQTALSTEGKRE